MKAEYFPSVCLPIRDRYVAIFLFNYSSLVLILLSYFFHSKNGLKTMAKNTTIIEVERFTISLLNHSFPRINMVFSPQ